MLSNSFLHEKALQDKLLSGTGFIINTPLSAITGIHMIDVVSMYFVRFRLCVARFDQRHHQAALTPT